MSAEQGTALIAESLRLGAINFLAKPVGVEQCRALAGFMKNRDFGRRKANQVEEIGRFEVLKLLFSGSDGTVKLVKDKTTEDKYALKVMHLENMSDEDKKAAECEVEFLRVLTGPTIIKLEEAWLENYKIHMVMEYAEGGNLADLLLKNRVVGRKFSSDQIMMYAAQLTLALLAIHSNSILHRDVKTQNVYIKDGVLKLGGFGIAKALASESDMAEGKCGTPYYMPPEVCQGLPYDSKVDVWALGVVIFELVTFRKPFNGDHINSLFDDIINRPLDPLPNEAGGDLQLLV